MSFRSNVTTPTVAAISFCLIGGTTPAYADLGDQLAKLLANDGAEADLFGVSVAISGATAIVGALLDDDNGTSSGSAYLFDISDPAKPTQIAKLLPDDGAAENFFGGSVAISGETAIVGAWGHDDNGSFSGSAYLFDTTTGRQLFKLLPNDGAEFDFFGISVAIDGTTAIVGASRDDDNGKQSGSAYLFDTTTGKQLFKLLPNDGAAGDWFGWSVGISGATAIVGTYRDGAEEEFSGSAWLFDTTTGLQIAKLLPDDGGLNHDRFGWSVGISGATAIVGANRDGEGAFAHWSGAAYLFDTTTGEQLFKLLPKDWAENDEFGYSVAISGTTAIVGAWRDDDNGPESGSAYLFDTTTGKQLFKLLPNDGAAGDFFGVSVAIRGETVIVGAYHDDDNGFQSGSAYLFDAAVPEECPWDIAEDGVVGAFDLLFLLVTWGPCKGCPADFDENGSVGASDLLALLANWGPCP